MARKIVYVSHPIRKQSRRADVQAVRYILDTLRIESRQLGTQCPVIPMAPYLLCAEVTEDITCVESYRVEGLTDLKKSTSVPFDELYLYGDVVCTVMELEIQDARKRGIPVIIKDSRLSELIN